MKKNLIALMVMASALFTNNSQATTIEFWYGNTGSLEKAILAACEGFNQSQSQDHVNCIGQGSSETAMQKAIAGYRTKNNPTLIQLFDAGTLDLMLSDAVLPLQEIMPEVDWQDFIPGISNFYETSKGQLFSQPYNSSTLILYVNKTQLAEAGITQLPETWEALIDTAQKLNDHGHTCPFVTDGHPWRLLEQFSARHGLPIATQHNGYEGLDSHYVFNQGLIAKHLQNMATWHDQGLVQLEGNTRAGKMVQAFNSGECAMMEGSSASYTDAAKAFGSKYQLVVTMAPIYQGYQRYNTLVGGAAIWLMKNHSTAEIAVAKSFLNYLRQPEQQLKFSASTGYLPVTQTAFNLVKQHQQLSLANPNDAVLLVGLESLSQESNANSRGVRLGFYVQFRDIFKEETQKAFGGKQSMQQALDRAQKRGDALLSRFAATYHDSVLP